MNVRTRRAVGGCALLALAALAAPRPAAALVVNGGFEAGTLEGWYASPGAVAFAASGTDPLGRGFGDPGDEWNPTEGGYFGVLHTSPISPESGAFTLLSSSFAASMGDLISFDAFFDAGEEAWSGRRGSIRLVSESGLPADVLFTRSVAEVGDYGAAGWSHIERSILATGTYRLELSLFFENGVPFSYDPKAGSALGVDEVTLGRVPAVPEPATLLLLGPAAAGLCGARAWRRRRATRQTP